MSTIRRAGSVGKAGETRRAPRVAVCHYYTLNDFEGYGGPAYTELLEGEYVLDAIARTYEPSLAPWSPGGDTLPFFKDAHSRDVVIFEVAEPGASLSALAALAALGLVRRSPRPR